MLGRLFSAAGQSRSPSSLESATEEQHTRNLLFSDTPLSSSHPWQGPTTGLRFGSFDDHNGFTVEEKDIRILLAQEDQERPSILFDSIQKENASASQASKEVPSAKHERTVSNAAPSQSYFGPQPETTTSSSLRSPLGAFQTRTRGSSMSVGQYPPQLSSSRDAESKDLDLLECMFGASSAARAGTRLHIIKASSKLPRVPSSPLVSPAALSSRTVRKPPLIRAQTSSLDMVLITRVFTVAPPGESEKEMAGYGKEHATTQPEVSSDPPGLPKPPKLREKKTPAYAVSLVIELPQQGPSRPLSRHGPQGDGQHYSPPASGSLESSWTFLDALPPSLSTPRSTQRSPVDANVDLVLCRWDTIVRHLSIMETIAKSKIFTLLSQVDDKSGRKTQPPKEKRMQRINQKLIRLPAYCLVNDQELISQSFRAINFIRIALSTPSVQPLPGGHWLEEARIVARLCGQRGNQRFLAVVLTAFLGFHREWVSEIGRELHLKWKFQQNTINRTVVICEDRILARRLVFLLASFLFPGMLSISMSTGKSRLTTSMFANDEGSSGGQGVSVTSRRRLQRNPSKTSHLSIPRQDSSFQKSSAGTTTTVTPNASTPLAYVTSTQQASDSYFPAALSAAGSGSAAAASLHRLRRSSSTASSMPSTWGSLLGSIWSNKQMSSVGTSNTTVPSEGLASTSASSRISDYQAPVSQLETMAQEVGTIDPVQDHHERLSSPVEREEDVPPRLDVNEEDGVIDVGLNLPDTLLHSYASSPDLPALPTPMSTSTASLDDAQSFFSASSPRTSADHVNNIAGYLKQYHPDFVLQAVRSLSEKSVRESMTSDSNADSADTPPGSSYEECNTLIADVQNLTVKRLTLRRKAQGSAKATCTEQMIEEYDETLADAIDRALDRPSAVPSRLPSPSPSKSQHFRTVSTSTTSTVNAPSPLGTSCTPAWAQDAQVVPVPQRNRGQLIIEALKEVIGSVDRDLHGSKRSENIPVGTNNVVSVSKPKKTEENVLREGVRRWLQGAEETSVW